jgi:lysophospholipase L1-like esterase
VRVLVQGDSITWGQGVQREQELFTTRLLTMLRRENLDTEMAVLAKPGREIDDHLVQIAKWGQEIDPEIIIYQFFINDVELDKNRPRTFRIWRRAFFHRKLLTHSYLWFFLDYNLNQWLPSKNKQSYSDYMLNRFASDTEEWKRSISVFRAWAREAKRLTPNVLIVLYPNINSAGRPRPKLLTINNWFGNLCEEQGFEVLDLWQSFGDLKGDVARIKSSIYDGHPSAEVHQRMAESIYKKLVHYRWIDVGEASDPSGKPAHLPNSVRQAVISDFTN